MNFVWLKRLWLRQLDQSTSTGLTGCGPLIKITWVHGAVSIPKGSHWQTFLKWSSVFTKNKNFRRLISVSFAIGWSKVKKKICFKHCWGRNRTSWRLSSLVTTATTSIKPCSSTHLKTTTIFLCRSHCWWVLLNKTFSRTKMLSLKCCFS